MHANDDKPDILYQASDATIAIWRTTVIAVWPSTPTAAAVRAVDSAMKRISRHCAPTYLGVSFGPTALPDEDTRWAFVRALRSLPRDAGVAVVLRGEGFGVSAIRAVITSFGLVARGSPPTRSFADIDEAARYLARISVTPIAPDALIAAADAVERAARAHLERGQRA